MASTSAPSISPAEASFFGKLAGDWWNPRGSSAMLHRITPLRSKFIRDSAITRFDRDLRSRHPLAGLAALDIGCGAGLMTEPLARMGAIVTGIDAAPENIAAAAAHATAGGLGIDYRATSVEALAATGARYDLVTCLEVVEHVADRDSFFAALARLVAPDMQPPGAATRALIVRSLALADWGQVVALIDSTRQEVAACWQQLINPAIH